MFGVEPLYLAQCSRSEPFLLVLVKSTDTVESAIIRERRFLGSNKPINSREVWVGPRPERASNNPKMILATFDLYVD